MPERAQCEFLEAPSVVYHVDYATLEQTKVANPDPFLCMWALHAGERLKDTPPWLPREASVGHLWRPGDCDACPCYAPKV